MMNIGLLIFCGVLILFVFGSGIAFLVVGTKKIISIIKELKQIDNKKYSTIMLISLVFPFIGLIIYAINIGTNEQIAKWALRGVKLFPLILFMLLVIGYLLLNVSSLF